MKNQAEPREPVSPDDPVRVRNERDLFVRILTLGTCEATEPFLMEALRLIIDITAADIAYIELVDLDNPEGAPWSLGHQCSDEGIDEIRDRISRGIIAEALAAGETLQTDVAMTDERFDMRMSVQAGHIESVLCAPIGDSGARGAVYLQSKQGAPPFGVEERLLTELFARHLAPLADRIFLKNQVRNASDPTLALREKYRLEEVVGRSPALAELLQQAMLAAPLDVNVLLTGSSGTGKSQIARVIHQNSARSDGPFVEVNCAAIPESLVESELFGALAGSHSEARDDRPGRIAAAEGGTLFLDEIGELPMGSQAKLLQLLQSRDYYPLGASEPRTANVRVIAATNIDLEAAMEEKRFRADLFYRLQVLPLRLPDLADRRVDLPELSRALLARSRKEHRLSALTLSPAALHAISAAEWPGNVRELQHTIEAAAIRAMGNGESEIRVSHLFPATSSGTSSSEMSANAPPATFQDATREFQRRLLADTLEACDWNVSRAAKRLDLARSHVYNLLKAFELERTD